LYSSSAAEIASFAFVSAFFIRSSHFSFSDWWASCHALLLAFQVWRIQLLYCLWTDSNVDCACWAALLYESTAARSVWFKSAIFPSLSKEIFLPKASCNRLRKFAVEFTAAILLEIRLCYSKSSFCSLRFSTWASRFFKRSLPERFFSWSWSLLSNVDCFSRDLLTL